MSKQATEYQKVEKILQKKDKNHNEQKQERKFEERATTPRRKNLNTREGITFMKQDAT